MVAGLATPGIYPFDFECAEETKHRPPQATAEIISDVIQHSLAISTLEEDDETD